VEDGAAAAATAAAARRSLWPLVRAVWLKVARNPNVYAGVLGVAWACVTNRCAYVSDCMHAEILVLSESLILLGDSRALLRKFRSNF
jgi:hypothetical protein